MVEIEAKFLIEEPGQISRLIENLQSDGLDVQPLAAVNMIDRYLDTPDWRIFQAGWAYRWRDASGKRKIDLKSVSWSAGAVQERKEVVQTVEAFPDNYHRVPKGPVAKQLKSIHRKAIHELFRIHNHRRLFNIRTAQGALIELAIDHAAITPTLPSRKLARGCMEFDELELELKEGSEESLREVVDMVQRQFGLPPSRLSKFERGLQAMGLSPPTQTRKEARVLEKTPFLRGLREQPLGRSDPAIKLAYRCLLGYFEEMLCEEPRAWEGLDPEGVHQMRVATRRMRAAFRAFKGVLPTAPSEEFNRQFKWVASFLGVVRDLDVYQDVLRRYTAEIPEDDQVCLIDYQRHLAQLWHKARKDLLAGLSGQRFHQLKDDFAQFLQRGPSDAGIEPRGSSAVGDAATRLIGKQYKRVLRDGRAIIPDSPDETLHALQIECKRLSYLFEFFQPIYGKSLRPFVKRLKKLQDVLGEFQDTCVATRQLRQYAKRVPMQARNRGQLIALGQLVYAQGQRAAASRGRFQDVWKGFDRKGRRRQIISLLG